MAYGGQAKEGATAMDRRLNTSLGPWTCRCCHHHIGGRTRGESNSLAFPALAMMTGDSNPLPGAATAISSPASCSKCRRCRHRACASTGLLTGTERGSRPWPLLSLISLTCAGPGLTVAQLSHFYHGFSLPNVTKPFELFIDKKQGFEKGVLTQKLGPWRRPIAYLSKKLDPVAS